jgi:predicted transposase YbfD/YdcC
VALRGNRALATGKKRSERVYAVTSLTSNKASAKELLEVARKHWKIENGLHYRRDRRLGDYCGFRIAEPGQAM